jgi:hypothetical protein
VIVTEIRCLFSFLACNWIPQQTKLGELVDSTPIGGLSVLPGCNAASVYNNRNNVLVEMSKEVSSWTFRAWKLETTQLSRNVGNRLKETRSHIS